MDPIRNPYAPGAGQRPPELAGRDEQLRAFDVVLERVAKNRPERSLVLTGLRGVGKTVLLNALRSQAVRRGWGTGKLEARPDQRLRKPLASALHQAVRELGHPQQEESDHALGVLRAFAERDAGGDAKLRDRWSSGHRRAGRPRPGRLRRHRDRPGRAADRPRRPGRGHRQGRRRVRRRDAGPRPGRRLRAVRRLPRDRAGRAAGHRRRCRAPAPAGGAERQQVLLRAAVLLPAHRPAHPRGGRPGADRAGRERGRVVRRRRRWPRCTTRPAATPTSSRPTARRSGTWPRGRPSPPPTSHVAAPEAERELAVGFFGSRYERATPGERDYLRAMADAASELPDDGHRPGRLRRDRRRGGVPRQEAAVALARPRRAAQEGPHLLRRARPDRLHGAALRALPAASRPEPGQPAATRA